MSILSKIAKLKKEQNEHASRIDGIRRKEAAVIQARMDKMFSTFSKYLDELDGETVEGYYVKVRGDSRSVLLFAGGVPIVQFTPHNEYVPCHCENMCNCKEYKYEITVTPAGNWRKSEYDWDDERKTFTIETISEQEALSEDEVASCVLRILEDWKNN